MPNHKNKPVVEADITAHFDNIHEVLLREIGHAQHSIVAAVAWFTDREIFDALRRRAIHGVSVRVAITDDEINRPPRAPAFDPLTALGAEIHRITQGSRGDALMHHKFCVIDETTVVTGSYNWTRQARKNSENVTVVRDHPAFAIGFLETFNRIVGSQGSDGQEVNAGQIRRRLELVRNLIQLGEPTEAEPHINRLRPVADAAGLSAVVRTMDSADYVRALEQIEHWLAKTSALITTEDIEVPHLRLRLQALEYQIEAFSAEQADLERRLVVFNRQHDEALGDLIKQILAARAELARLEAQRAQAESEEKASEARKAHEFANQQYHEYTEAQEELQKVPRTPRLDADAEAELKRLYRRASQRCHPDKVDESQRTTATEIFHALQAAYRNPDLDRVREIYQLLEADGLSLSIRSSVLSEADRLRAAISELEQHLSTLTHELRTLKDSPAVLLMERVSCSDSEWEEYIALRRDELREDLVCIRHEIQALSR